MANQVGSVVEEGEWTSVDVCLACSFSSLSSLHGPACRWGEKAWCCRMGPALGFALRCSHWPACGLGQVIVLPGFYLIFWRKMTGSAIILEPWATCGHWAVELCATCTRHSGFWRFGTKRECKTINWLFLSSQWAIIQALKGMKHWYCFNMDEPWVH